MVKGDGNGRSTSRGSRFARVRGGSTTNIRKRRRRPSTGRVVLTVINISLAMLFVVLVTVDRMKIGRELSLGGSGFFFVAQEKEATTLPQDDAALSAGGAAVVEEEARQPLSDHHHHMLFAAIDANSLWKDLIVEGGQLLLEDTTTNGTRSMYGNEPITQLGGIEIGMHRANQCIFGAKHGLHMMCFEPSPPNYQRVVRTLRQQRKRQLQKQQKQSPGTHNNIRVYNLAVGNTTGNFINFEYSADPKGLGSTGDHVGNGIDMWNMMVIVNNNNNDTTTSTASDTNSSILPTKETIKTQVKTVKLDDIIMVQGGGNSDIVPSYSEGPSWDDHINQDIYVAKIDTQGYEPAVFEGMTETILSQRIHFIITEFWPKGMDLLYYNGSIEKDEACQVPVQMLQLLLRANYTLYATKVESHPLAPKGAKQVMNNENRPPMIISPEINLLMDHCMYYRRLEERFPSSDHYKMGYWTDILAISPNARLPNNPMTDIGKRLQSILLLQQKQQQQQQ